MLEQSEVAGTGKGCHFDLNDCPLGAEQLSLNSLQEVTHQNVLATVLDGQNLLLQEIQSILHNWVRSMTEYGSRVRSQDGTHLGKSGYHEEVTPREEQLKGG